MHGDIGETAWALDSKGRERRRALPKYQYPASWMVVVSCLDGAEQVVGAESVDRPAVAALHVMVARQWFSLSLTPTLSTAFKSSNRRRSDGNGGGSGSSASSSRSISSGPVNSDFDIA